MSGREEVSNYVKENISVDDDDRSIDNAAKKSEIRTILQSIDNDLHGQEKIRAKVNVDSMISYNSECSRLPKKLKSTDHNEIPISKRVKITSDAKGFGLFKHPKKNENTQANRPTTETSKRNDEMGSIRTAVNDEKQLSVSLRNATRNSRLFTSIFI